MKKSNWAISSFIMICLFTFFFILDKSKNRSFVEQRSVTTMGYENGSPVFKININNVRQESYKHILFAKGVINGTVFNTDNHKVITNLSGDNGRINTHVKSILVTGNIHATIHPSKSKRIIKIIANEFFYTHRKKESRFKDKAQ